MPTGVVAEIFSGMEAAFLVVQLRVSSAYSSTYSYHRTNRSVRGMYPFRVKSVLWRHCICYVWPLVVPAAAAAAAAASATASAAAAAALLLLLLLLGTRIRGVYDTTSSFNIHQQFTSATQNIKMDTSPTIARSKVTFSTPAAAALSRTASRSGSCFCEPPLYLP